MYIYFKYDLLKKNIKNNFKIIKLIHNKLFFLHIKRKIWIKTRYPLIFCKNIKAWVLIKLLLDTHICSAMAIFRSCLIIACN